MRARSPNEVLNWLIVVLAFALPLYRAWVSLAAYLILILWFFQGGLRDRIDRLRHHPLTLAITVFLVLNLASLLWSSYPSDGFDYWRKYTYLLLVPAIASSLRPRFAGRAFLALVAGAVLSVSLMPIVIFADIHMRHVHPWFWRRWRCSSSSTWRARHQRRVDDGSVPCASSRWSGVCCSTSVAAARSPSSPRWSS